MIKNNRIFHDDNGTPRDLSIALNDITGSEETIAIVSAEDSIILGSDFPFNHRYIRVSSANDQASSVSVELYSGSDWVSAVDVIDSTKSGANTLAQNGIISWVPDKNEAWGKVSESKDIPELSTGPMIYDFYWVKISFC